MAEEIPGAPSAGPQRAVALLAILWLTALTWWLALPSEPGYSFDDREAIVGNPVVTGELPASEAFRRDYWHHLGDAGHYRPLATLALRFDASRVDVESVEAPRTFRLTNLALHLLVILVAGVGLILLERRGGPVFPWFGLALMAVHPASADAAAWISGRTSLLSALGGALTLLIVAAGRRESTGGIRIAFGVLAGVGVALLGKEDGLVIAAAAPIVALALPVAEGAGKGMRAKRSFFALIGALLAVSIVGWLRHGALGSALPAAPSAPLGGLPLVDRVALGMSAWWQGAVHALAPWIEAPPSLHVSDLTQGASAHSPEAALVYGAGVAGLGLAGVSAVSLIAAWLVRRTPGARISLALSCLAVLPLIQLVPAGELFAPRFLYQPLLLGVLWLAALGRRLGLLPQVGILVTLACFSIFQAAPTYDSRASYWEAHLPSHDGEAKVWNALGQCSRESGDLEKAEQRFLRSHDLDPSYSRPLANLGAMAAKAGDLEAAEAWLTEAIFEGRAEHAPRGNLATVLLRLGRTDEALEFYTDAARLSPGRATYHRGIARACISLGQLKEASTALEVAEQLAPTSTANKVLREDLESAQIATSTGDY
jgi:tetratricopeptide (TPR) repeat protein